MDTVEEVWKQHPIYDLYEGSDLGRVRFSETGRVQKPSATNAGYLKVTVRSAIQTKQKSIELHRFIYGCFNGDVPLASTDHIDHINDNKTDNRLENLQKMTRQENNKKAQINRDMNKITCGKIVKIIATNATTNEALTFKSKYQCGAHFNKSPAMIYFALHNKNNVKHIVTDQGNWLIEELAEQSD